MANRRGTQMVMWPSIKIVLKLVLFRKQQFDYKINKKVECIAEYMHVQMYIHMYTYIITLCIQFMYLENNDKSFAQRQNGLN